jgi:hypothetical protein
MKGRNKLWSKLDKEMDEKPPPKKKVYSANLQAAFLLWSKLDKEMDEKPEKKRVSSALIGGL